VPQGSSQIKRMMPRPDDARLRLSELAGYNSDHPCDVPPARDGALNYLAVGISNQKRRPRGTLIIGQSIRKVYTLPKYRRTETAKGIKLKNE
jgi:hypothetical protein